MATGGGSSNGAGTSPVVIALLLLSGVYYARPADVATIFASPSSALTSSKRASSAVKVAAPAESATDHGDSVHRDPELVAVEHTAAYFIERGYTEESLVATVSDPIESHDGWLFDLRLDAIVHAIEDAQFYLDRAYVPWRYAPQGKPAAQTANDDKYALVLFRDPAGQRLLKLYVVGETPTWGIDRDAFQAVMAHLPSSTTQVRIVGPTYSGSALSLHHAIADAAKARRESGAPAPVRFQVRSGSATRFATRATLEKADLGLAKNQVDYRATVLPDGTLTRALWCYLEARGVRPENVAMLREATTAYGRSPKKPTETSDDGAPRSCCLEPLRCYPRFEIPFPMQISQVRSAYERNNLLRRAEPSQPSAPVQKTLELSLDETGDPHDVLLPVTPAITASTNEIVLSNILRTIASESILYVGIMATDTRDKLFLARAIRANIPDVRLFTFEADLLYAHPDYQEYLDGMLVASSYPLFAREQIVPSVPGEGYPTMQFSSQGAEGTYNATLASLGAEQMMVDYHPELESEGGRATGSSAPASWLMAVSHGMLWPLDKRPATSGDANDYVVRASIPPGRMPTSSPSNSASVLFALLTVFCAVHFWDQVASTRSPGSDAAGIRVAAWKLAYAQSLVAIHMLAGLPIVAYALRPSTDAGGFGILVYIGVAAVVVVGVLGFIVSCQSVLAIVQGLASGARWSSARWAVCVVPFVPYAVLAWHWHTVATLTERVAWVRIVSPESGLSPLLPMLLAVAVIVLAARCGWRRASLLADSRQTNPLDGRIAELDRDLDAVLRRPFRAAVAADVVGRALPAVALVAALVPCVILSDRVWDGVLLSFETVPYNRWFLAVIILGHLLLVFETARLVAAWSVFRRLLHALAFHRLYPAYARIPKPLQRRIRQLFYCYLVENDDLASSLRAAPREAPQKSGGVQAPPKELPPVPPSTEATTDDVLVIGVAASIGYQCTQMRNVAVFLVSGALLMFLGLNVYPFQPAGLLTMFCGTTVVVVVAILLYIVFRMDRDEVLSHLAGSDAGVLTVDQSLIGRVLTFGVLPIAAVVATQFPAVGRLFTSILRIVN